MPSDPDANAVTVEVLTPSLGESAIQPTTPPIRRITGNLFADQVQITAVNTAISNPKLEPDQPNADRPVPVPYRGQNLAMMSILSPIQTP